MLPAALTTMDRSAGDAPGPQGSADRSPAPAPSQARLKITEVFLSLQGETSRSGLPTVFIRLTGCPLRCRYCDSAYAFHGGQWRSLRSLVDEALAYQVRHVTVTGGEPLAQRRCLDLLVQLCDAGFSVSLETGGAHDIAAVDARVSRIVDIKTPGSGEAHRNLWSNIELLRPSDELKFVICDRSDFDWALEQIRAWRLAERCPVLFSPSHGELAPQQLAEWILAARAPVRFQLQLHKQLWGDVPGR